MAERQEPNEGPEALDPIIALTVAVSDLSSNIGTFAKKLIAVEDYGKRTRFLTRLAAVLLILDVAYTITVGIVAYDAHQAAQIANRAATAAQVQATATAVSALATCRSSNEFRAENALLWKQIEALVLASSPTALPFVQAIKKDADTAFTPRVCAPVK
jgi:hypothetical protein